MARTCVLDVFVVAALLLCCVPGRAENVTVDTGDEIIILAEPPSVATSPAESTVTYPAEAAAAAASIPTLQLGQTVENRVSLVRSTFSIAILCLVS